MSVYNVKLVKKELLADATMAFYFEKPVGFNYEAGQFAYFVLLNPAQTDSEGNDRCFTLSSSPYEQTIVFATRMRDTAFKRSLGAMEIGSKIKIDGPNGNLVLDNSLTPVVFLTGGIGVTPARSIIAQAIHDSLDRQIYLFYSNKTVNSAIFLDEFKQFAKSNSNFHLILTITDPTEQNINEETGHIDGDMLRRYIPDLLKPEYYISGPPAMVESLRDMLKNNDIKKSSIHSEEFSGYK